MTKITCSEKSLTLGAQVPQVILLTLSDYSPLETAIGLFLQAIECAGGAKPCRICDSCSRSPWKPLVHVSIFDSGQGLSKEEVLVVRQAVQSSGSESERPRVFVIGGVEYMSAQAANTLLKFLEETPPGTFFILTTRQISKVLPTIVSRSSVFSVASEPEIFRSEVASFCNDANDLLILLNACADAAQARRLLESESFFAIKEVCLGMSAYKKGRLSRMGLINLIKTLDYHELALCRKYLVNFFDPAPESIAAVVNLDRKPLKVIVADEMVAILEGI